MQAGANRQPVCHGTHVWRAGANAAVHEGSGKEGFAEGCRWLHLRLNACTFLGRQCRSHVPRRRCGTKKSFDPDMIQTIRLRVKGNIYSHFGSTQDKTTRKYFNQL
ncbi:unnamed protein product [Symbiodinium sp. KB8]|nr:unnamed protein product [Symbiodinium sp. KB8]